jgi:hypothetical protein
MFRHVFAADRTGLVVVVGWSLRICAAAESRKVVCLAGSHEARPVVATVAGFSREMAA